MTNNEPTLQRFIDAQATAYPTALAEMKNGRKQSHWMWYIFPQIQGLGSSATSQYYALQSAQEAAAYLKHPLLGPRLTSICEAVLGLAGHDATRLMGSPDDVKLKSCMTLFASLPAPNPVFQRVLDKFFQGQQDAHTLRILDQQSR